MRLTFWSTELSPVLADLRLVSAAPAHSGWTAYELRDSKQRQHLCAVNLLTDRPQHVELIVRTTGQRVLRLPDEKEIPALLHGEHLVWEDVLPAGGGVLYRIE